MQIVIVFAIIAALFAAHHYHLIATIKELFPKHASSPVPPTVAAKAAGQ